MNAPLSPSDTLRTALAHLLDGLPPKAAAQAVERLIVNYRGRTPTDAPVLRDRSDVVAYAAYRMPATFEAVCAALEAFARAVPGWEPGSHVDVGGGTGAATWAVNATWPGGRPVTVLDWAEPALALGREIAAAHPDLKPTEWQRSRIGAALTIESTDLVTISYVLGELTDADRTAVVDAAATAAQAVVVIEPGTPDGYARVIDARDRLVAAGFHVAAPCPHSAACPIVPGEDWCHFAARVSRSSLHRQVKGGSLAYEDEKFSYVAATRFAPAPAASRVVRKPQIRKGQVLLDLCGTGTGTSTTTDAATTALSGADGDGGSGPGTGSGPVPTLGRTTVTKRHGPLYKAARDADWGDAWPPPTGDDDRA
ncbi:small ribosomal subunit Rsm22 family protein [Streptomyces neyagawaensis]|uniref:small ribosomal subunit Rsm22 family protein n=1 Tax=Streptomyces neyagawaensis TaxID=42238 RepID=UPI0006E2FBE2|nr:small ribosomal subunit Rsm22 family protein [Streptomyces neyagawaensis]MCL6732667.1 small ribosomal subunit Rsm22 family protein [Streptomyces neyagawaensis]MDE1681563.1 small ribosomal subunit Rsm22 family protein [Streptomyces neyagawaensis]